MQEHDDILAGLESEDMTSFKEAVIIENSEANTLNFEWFKVSEDKTETVSEEKIEKKVTSQLKKSFSWAMFMLKYVSTSIWIFWVLLLASNYSAYWNLASSYIYADDLENSKNGLIQSVAAWNVTEQSKVTEEVDSFKQVWSATWKENAMHDMNQFVSQSKNNAIDLGIEITPYENRIVIPKIGKNIPLLDITQTKVEWQKELDDIFMKELENWVIRYPGSAKPGEEWNSFIFGHSSNFPWIDGDYNDVFALLDRVSFEDEVIVYYGQEKYIYKVNAKNVIRPWDVSVLKKDNDDRKKLTLMTCWPIGTTLNRLVLTAELIEIQK